MRTPSSIIRIGYKQSWDSKIIPFKGNHFANIYNNEFIFFNRLSRRIKKHQRSTNYGLIYSHYISFYFLNRILNIKVFLYDGTWLEKSSRFSLKRVWRKKSNKKKLVISKFSKKFKQRIYKRFIVVKDIRNYFTFKYSRRFRAKNWFLKKKFRKVGSVSIFKYAFLFSNFFIKGKIQKMSSMLYRIKKIHKNRFFTLNKKSIPFFLKKRNRFFRHRFRYFEKEIKERFFERRLKSIYRMRWRLHIIRVCIWLFRFSYIIKGYFNKKIEKRISFQFFGSGNISSSSVSRYVIGALANRYRINTVSYRFINGLKRFRFNNGVIIQASGRFDRKQIASYSEYKYGKVAVNLLRSRTRYSFSFLRAKYGVCGIKIWLPDKIRREELSKIECYSEYYQYTRKFYIKKLHKNFMYWQQYQKIVPILKRYKNVKF